MIINSTEYRVTQNMGNQKKRKFGSVSCAIDTSTQQKVIIKTTQKTTTNNHIINRLINETKHSFEFDSLPKVLNYEVSDKELTLVLAYKNGITLSELWHKTKSTKQLELLQKIIQNLVPTLEYLRVKGVFHCDIKPENIIVHPETFDCHIIDFGLALKKDNISTSKTLFSLGYASPELVLNRLNIINHTSDLYALGITIWRLFAEKLPFTHPNPSVMTNLQITYPLPDHPALPKGLFEVLSKMCFKHSFKTAPNKMKSEDLLNVLIHAQDQRFPNSKLIEEHISHLKQRSFFGINY